MGQLIHHFKQSQFNNSTGFTTQPPASFNLFCLNHLMGRTSASQLGWFLTLHLLLPAQPCQEGLTLGDNILYPLTPSFTCVDIKLRELVRHFPRRSFNSENPLLLRLALIKTPAETPQIKYKQVKQRATVSKMLGPLKEVSSLLGWEFYTAMLPDCNVSFSRVILLKYVAFKVC